MPKPIIRHDDEKAHITMHNVNEYLSVSESECIENNNINSQHFGGKGLHLNPKGKTRLALNFLNKIENFTGQ